ncbi:jg23734 [Pararge aegeria aegeria]|uniref:Jg23734 protein n=1 Tax=Pararge aegeria aegeria TaxID=348720 RepID=A0A8S4RBW5_9NEOP|nr:jg23734 [Pararge aegeria aegeria]
MRIGDIGGVLLEAAKLTRSWFCQKPGYGFSQKVDEEEGGGGVALHPPDGFYSHQHSIHSGHHAHNAEPDRGYMEGNRYVTAVHRPLPALNHSNSSCSSASNASTGAALCAGAAEPAPPLYIAAPPEGFGMAVHTNRYENIIRRGTDVGIIGTTGMTQKDPSLPQKRGKLTRGRYEMSQDLLDKQVEILERRYGGLRARRAAVTIQRAFRRRQLLKKFSAITAMAKAADSNARRLQDGSDHLLVNGNDIYANTLLQKSPGSSEKVLALTRPMRSMSLRERHDIDMSNHMSCDPQSEVEAMVARVHQSAHQIHMIASELPPHHRGDADSGVSETVRKRQYRVGLNLFNKKPERGIAYLISRGFLENSPRGVARFLITRKGLSKQMIGEYLGNLQSQFNMAVLECFVNELDLSGMAVDVALRRYQAHFRLPGEAQKIERLVEAFARRYCVCNTDFVQRLRTQDTIFVLAFAIIMLNTDLHTPNLKPEARMSLDDFVRNLRGIDDCGDIDRDMLAGIYDRVKASEFRPGSDHVTQVMKVQATIVGKKPHLALPHRRLVCYCRLYEIPDIHKKERPGVHQREVFLFNDLLVITKIFSKKKSSVTYTFRQSFPLCGMLVNLFSVPHYPFGIRLSRRVDGRRLATFNARNEHDRCKFAEDLRESVAEMDEMEAMRIEGELNRGKGRNTNNSARNVALAAERLQRRGSVGSLDSGMSVSFQQGSRTALHATSPRHPPEQRSPGRLFGGIFPGRQRKLSASGVPDTKTGQVGKSTEV